MKTPGPRGKHQSAPFVLLWENCEWDSQTNTHMHTKSWETAWLKSFILRHTWLDRWRCRVLVRSRVESSERGSPSPPACGKTHPGCGQRKREEDEEEAAAANHSVMAFLSFCVLKLSFFPSFSPCFFPSSSSSSSGAVWVCADSRGRGGERHPESASSVKASHPPPTSRSLSTGFLCPLKTDISLCPSPRSVSLFCLCLLFTSIYTVYLWMSCQISHLDPYSQWFLPHSMTVDLRSVVLANSGGSAEQWGLIWSNVGAQISRPAMRLFVNMNPGPL